MPEAFLLPQLGNVRIFVNDLMRLHPQVFEAFSVESNNTYGLDRLLAGRELPEFVDSDAIPEIDDLVISEMIKLLAKKEDISEYLRSRETSFYYTSKKADYRMLAAANNFRITARAIMPLVKSSDKDTAIALYAEELHKVDTAYRHFNFYYDRTDKTDEYMNLAKEVEYLYGEEWMLKLAEKWEESTDDESVMENSRSKICHRKIWNRPS